MLYQLSYSPNIIYKLPSTNLLCFFKNNMLPENRVIFFKFYSFRMKFSAFGNGVAIPCASCTFKLNDISFTIASHNLSYSTISVTTPAPTVCPPSRIANLNSLSIAIDVIKETSNSTLSPGITISVPSGNVTTPVTSVVLK